MQSPAFYLHLMMDTRKSMRERSRLHTVMRTNDAIENPSNQNLKTRAFVPMPVLKRVAMLRFVRQYSENTIARERATIDDLKRAGVASSSSTDRHVNRLDNASSRMHANGRLQNALGNTSIYI
jgi:hypothetical protein